MKDEDLPPMSHPPHVIPYEKAARLYCAKAGLDPEEFKDMPHETIHGAFTRIYRWYAVAEELIDFSMKLTSMREAAQSTNVKSKQH